VVDKFKAKNIDPEGYVLYTYAAVQVWAQAAAQAKTTDPKKVAETIHKGKWNTVLGPVSYDANGDITFIDYVFYVWKNGKYSELQGEKWKNNLPKGKTRPDPAGFFSRSSPAPEKCPAATRSSG